MQLYCAGAFSAALTKQAVEDAGVSNLLISYGYPKSAAKETDYFNGRHGQPRPPKVIGKDSNGVLLYCAGTMNPKILKEMGDRSDAKNWLETNAQGAARDCAVYIATESFDFKIFVDSGAFTAWVKNRPIVLADYIAFAKDLHSRACCPIVFAALDVIPGKFKGAPASPEELERCCQQGFENYLEMTSAGVPCLPTFHRDDPDKWLDIIIDAVLKTDHHRMCLAPKVDGLATSIKMRWLNKCYLRIDELGLLNTLKIHGLGISSPVMMETYPFYSVDSTAWLKGGNSGCIRFFDGHRSKLINPVFWGGFNVVKGHNGELIGDATPLRTVMTSVSLDAIRHYRPAGQADLVYYFHERCMREDAKLEERISQHWKERGITWDD